MEMSEGLSQQERLQAIAEKRKRQTEIENKKRQLEDDRRQLSHLKQKSLRERWLLDGAAGSEQDEAKKQLAEDEAKLKGMEENIIRMEQELEELETGVSATSTKESLTDATTNEEAKTADNKAPAGTVQEVKEVTEVKEVVKVHTSPHLEMSGGASDRMRAAMYSVEITVERDNVTGETKVLSTNTLLPINLSGQGVKVYEDYQKVVHEVNGENGVHQLSANEVDELIHKADESMMSDATTAGATSTAPVVPTDAELAAEQQTTPQKEITGMKAKAGGSSPQPGGGEVEASAENPVTMVFMGYQSVEDEAETNKVLGLEGTVKAQLVVIEDGEGKNVTVGPNLATVTVTEGGTKEEQSPPPNGSAADPVKTPQEKAPVGEKGGEPEGGATELNNKEKQPCKCCTIM
ncbi:paralemmin 1a isoform X3 [Salmo salar]|uniref:Paralemmin-1 n=1 Tax=Salmo salar TaxID=8030 RepID=A0A1S3T4L3_SALSA|nr:paralemmin 1a isoform X3 [Salmo salar]|eukprot:XP_014071524.1 PREDICTED: paralemmin-1-like isoform X2 [Salmo salar]